MTKFFDTIDRYKYGLLAALSVYIGLFMYFTMDTYESYYFYEPFHDGSYVDLNEEYVELKPDNIEIPAEYQSAEIKNMVNDRNDDRERSMENYSDRRSSSEVEQSVYDLEKQMYEEAGGASERERIEEQMKEREKSKEQKTTNPTNTQSKTGGDNAYGGLTMVDFDLKGRSPYQDNDWYIRNPGYTSYGNGTVVVDIVVNQNGNVVSATVNSVGSAGANQRMMEQAVKYALMSRFNYSGSTKTQKGTITYRFVSK